MQRVLDDPKRHRRRIAGDRDASAAPTPAPRASPRSARRARAYDPNADRDDHLHRRHRRLQLQPGRHDGDAADRQRHRHLERRPADQPERLRAAARRRAGQRRHARRRPTAFPAGNNGNAHGAARPARRDARRRSRLAGGVARRRRTITDAYASALAAVGVRVQSAKARRRPVGGDRAPTRRRRAPTKSGVNLDEEAARLIQYQQSYQAAAKMLQVAQSLFDTLLQAGADADQPSRTEPDSMRIAPPTPSTAGSTR